MFERFTARARQVVVEATTEARRQHHVSVYPEHLLAGFFLEAEGMAAVVLESCGWTLAGVRDSMKQKYAPLEDAPIGQIPFDASTSKALELALRETLSLGHNWIGTEHVLLGLCRLNENPLFTLEEARTLREETIRLLSGSRRSEHRPARPARLAWNQLETRPRCHAGFSLYGASFHCQSDLDHSVADGHVEHGDGWTVRWDC